MKDVSKIQVVVLMGGIGSRLKGVTKEIPKSMLPIHGKPFFLYEFNLLCAAGFNKFLFLVGYKAELIEEFFGNGSQFNVKIQYSYDGPEQLGTGGAIVNAYEKLNDDFLLIYGDTLLDIDYAEVVYRFYKGKEVGCQALMTVFYNEENLDKSNVVIRNGEIKEYNKTSYSPKMKYIDYGMSVYDKRVFQEFPQGTMIDLSDIQTRLVSEGLMSTCIVRKRFYEIGTPKALQYFKNYAKQRYFTPNKAVFLDRDGVINELVFNDDTEQLDSPLSIDQFVFIDGVIQGLRILKEKGYLVFVLTNQPAAAKGKAKLTTLYDINGYMLDQLKEKGVEIEAIQMCPHHPKGSIRADDKFLIQTCQCRKPGTKMIDDILKKYCIDKGKSYMIGDSFTDIIAGKTAGLKTAFIGDYKCDVCKRLKGNKPDITGNNLIDIANRI